VSSWLWWLVMGAGIVALIAVAVFIEKQKRDE
jgi:hypothetical protein